LLAIPGSVAPAAAEGLSPAPGSAGCGIDWPTAEQTSRSWLFEAAEKIGSVDVSIPSMTATGSDESGGLRIGVVDTSGQVEWPALASRSKVPGGIVVKFVGTVDATGLVASGQGAGEIADTSVVSGPQVRLDLDGPLQDALDKGGWRYSGRVAGFARYTLDVPAPTVWIGGGGPGASTSRLSTTAEGGETDYVVADRPVVVERSEAFAAGWQVQSLNLADGARENLAVQRAGLVQAVKLPAGRYRIVWSYWPPGLSLGLLSSSVGVLVLLVAAVLVIASRRRRRRRLRADAQSVQGSGRSVAIP
jgi:hypothetical protein